MLYITLIFCQFNMPDPENALLLRKVKQKNCVDLVKKIPLLETTHTKNFF